MKKILLLLISLCAGSLLFGAQIDRSTFPPTLNITSVLDWGMDLKTGATGFSNALSGDLILPLIGTQSFQTVPQDVYGKIEVDNLNLNIGVDLATQTVTPSLGSYTASAEIVFKPFYVSIFNTPQYIFQESKMVGSTGQVSGTLDSNFTYGLEWGVKNETAPDLPYQFALQLLSYSDINSTGGSVGYTSNTANKYMIAGNFIGNLVPELLDLHGNLIVKPSQSFGWNGIDVFAGAQLPISFDVLYGFQIIPAIDTQISAYNKTTPYSFSASSEFILSLSPFNQQKAFTNIDALVSYGADKNLSASLSFSEPDEGGILDQLGWTVQAKVIDINTNPNFSGLASIEDQIKFDGYNQLTPQIVYTIGNSLDSSTLTPNITFQNINSIPNTTFSFIYNSTDLLSRWSTHTKWDPGSIKVEAAITF